MCLAWINFYEKDVHSARCGTPLLGHKPLLSQSTALALMSNLFSKIQKYAPTTNTGQPPLSTLLKKRVKVNF